MLGNSFLVLGQLYDLLQGMEEDKLFVLMIISIGCFTAIVISLAGMLGGIWSSIRSKQIEADLKQDMLDRGMSAEEIQQVVEAAPKSGVDRWVSDWCKKS